MLQTKVCSIVEVGENNYLVQYKDGTVDIMTKAEIKVLGGDFVFASKGEFKNMESATNYHMENWRSSTVDLFELGDRPFGSTKDLVE